MSSRRTDNQLRSAISVIEAMLLTNPTADTILKRSLGQLMTLLGATFGYAYQCHDPDDQGDVTEWELTGCFEYLNDSPKEVENSCTSYKMPEELRSQFISGRCVYNNNVDKHFRPVPHRNPGIKNYYCIPLADLHNVHAVLFLCNTISGFDEGIEKRIQPFIAAAGCLLRSAKKARLHRSSSGAQANLLKSPEVLINIFDSMFNAVLIVNTGGEITACNTAAASMLGLPRRGIIGEQLTKFLPRGGPRIDSRLINENDLGEQQATDKTREALTPRAIWRGVPALTADGEKILVDLGFFEVEQDGEVMRGLVMDDISDRMKSAADYHSTLERFQVLTTLAPVGIVQLNRTWECTYANDTWCEYCQMTPDEASGVGWIDGLHPHDADQILENLRADIAKSGKCESEFRLQSPLGIITWVKLSACGLYEGSGEISGLIMTFNDVSDHRKNEERLQSIAERDQLTGLINRAFFNDRMEIALKGIRRFGSVVLMFIDLDEFKHINDTLGHDAGDQLLTNVADRLRETMRNVDTIARIGGDEFTLLMTNVQNTRAITGVADKIIDSLSVPFVVGNRPIYVTASIGIAVATQEDSDAKMLLKQADIALYKAKDAGRNRYKFYTPELDRDADLHIYLRQSLKEKGRNDFRVVYQPQVDARTNEIVGLEALTRWQHHDADPVEPTKFIKMIEESGLLDDFSEWLLEDIFKTLNRWSSIVNFNKRLKVSINLSAKQFREKELAFYIYQRCRANGIQPSSIVLEVTETALIDDPELAATTLEKLRSMGFGLSFDDFGTGYSSLAYLRDMPLDTVKIDRSFIKDVMHDESDAKIVSAIINLAATLDLKVIAEGVDNPDVRAWLIDHDCFVHQGFYFYKPMECEDIEALLRISTSRDNVIRIDDAI